MGVMRFGEYVQIFPGVIFNPTKAFTLLASGELSFKHLFAILALPILILGSYGRVLGEVRVSDPAALPPIIAHIVVHLLVFCLGVFLGSLMLSKLAPRYGVSASFSSVAQVTLLAYIPVCLALFISGLIFGGVYLVLAGLLVGLLFWGMGIRIVAGFPSNRLVGFVFMALIIFMGVMYFSLFLLRNLLVLIY